MTDASSKATPPQRPPAAAGGTTGTSAISKPPGAAALPPPAAVSPPHTPVPGAASTTVAGGGRAWLFGLWLIGVAIGTYWPAGSGALVGRDLQVVSNNPHIRVLAPREIPLSAAPGSWLVAAPLAGYSLALDYSRAARTPAPYHYTQLMLHALSALLLFGLVRRALSAPRWRERFGSRAARIGFAVALLWLVHPLAAEGTYLVSARPLVLAGFFTLAALYFFQRTTEGGAAWFWGLLTLLCAAAAPLAVSRAFLLPILLILYDRAFAAGSFGALVARRWLLHALLLLTLLIPLQQSLSGILVNDDAPPPPAGALLAVGALLPGHLAHLTLAPYPLAAVYDDFFASPSPALRWGYLALLTALVISALVGLWRNSAAGFLAGAFLLLTLHAALFGGAHHALGESALNYLPATAAIALLVALTLRIWPRRLSALLPIVTLSAAGALGYLTFQRGKAFQENAAYWSDTLAKRPRSVAAHLGRAEAFVAEKNYSEAVATLQKAAELAPSEPRVHIRLAAALGKNRDNFAATKSLRSAEEQAGDRFHYLRQIERVFLDLKLYDDALRLMKEHLNKRWDDPPVHLMMAELCDALNKPKEAMQHLEEAVKKAPRSAIALSRMGLRLSRDNLTQDAEQRIRQAIEYAPAYPEAYFALGQNALQANKPSEALAPLAMASRLEPENALTHYYLGLAHHMAGQSRPAVVNYERALALQDDMLACLNNLAWILATDPEEAVRNPERAVTLAQKMVERGGHNIPGYLDTLAAAHAAAGRFPEAVEKAKFAVDLLTRAYGAKAAEDIQSRLDLYLKNEPYREKPKEPQ